MAKTYSYALAWRIVSSLLSGGRPANFGGLLRVASFLPVALRNSAFRMDSVSVSFVSQTLD